MSSLSLHASRPCRPGEFGAVVSCACVLLYACLHLCVVLLYACLHLCVVRAPIVSICGSDVNAQTATTLQVYNEVFGKYFEFSWRRWHGPGVHEWVLWLVGCVHVNAHAWVNS